MEKILALGGGMLIAVGGSTLLEWRPLETLVAYCLVVIMLKQLRRD